jgi:putative membrane-bound dehydrogenase-like protein
MVPRFEMARPLCSLLLTVIIIPSSAQDAWQSIPVPGAWEQAGPPTARDYDGFAWYRAWLKPHDSFFSRHERNLFEESVTLGIRNLADAHEVFVNGVKIGAGGALPPQFASGRDGNHRHKVPPGTLKKGEWNLVAVRVYNRTGPGGFLTEAPFIMNYFQECVFEGEWEFRVGDDPAWAKGEPLKEKPARAAFDAFHDSNRVLGEAEHFVHGAKLPPQESFALMKAGDDLAVDLLLHEPLVAQPVYLSFDERGRLWVAQYRQYPYPAGLKMLSRDRFYRSHYDKVPPPPPNHDRGRDVISIHEDTDGDGVFDRNTVFQDGLNMVNAALRGYGGVWVMNPPYLMFYPDANGDDLPDGPPEVRLQGFGLEDTHSVANGIVWGMDGWLYGGQGSTTTSHVTRPGIDPPDSPGVYFQGCMVWRYHPQTRAYEIFAEGSGNTFGLEVDAQGRLFSGHNGGSTRGWHYVQGAYFLVQGVDPGKFGPPRSPYTFGELPMMKTGNPVARFTHFGAMVEGTAMPSRYQGTLFGVDPLHNVVIASERRPLGATFETLDIGGVLTNADVSFRPVYIANAPDGSVYIADMYEFYIAHGQHYQSQIDPTTGRIFRLRGKDQPLEKDLNLAVKGTDQLIPLLSHPNKWHRHTAVRLLAERRDPAALPKLRRLLQTDPGLGALCALWALHQCGGLDDATALQSLQHRYAPVRAWTVRFLGETYGTHPGLGAAGVGGSQSKRPVPGSVSRALLAQAGREPDVEVRSQMAASARRLPVAEGLALTRALLAREEDVKDSYVPLLAWWVLEANVPSHPDAVVALFKDATFWEWPMVSEHILWRVMKRFALEGRRQDLLQCAQLLRLAPSPDHAAKLMKGFEEAFRGRALVGLPDELLAAMAGAGQSPLILRVRQGEAAAVEEALKLVQDAKAKPEDRLLYTRAFGEVKTAMAVPALLSLAETEKNDTLRNAALAALAAYDDESIGAKVASLLPALPEGVRRAALTLLVSRPGWSMDLLKLLERGALKPDAVPVNLAEQLHVSRSQAVRDLAAKVLPKTSAPLTADAQKKLAEVETILKRAPGNPYAGEPIFMERCGVCHKLFFKGGNLGPDLTAYQRDNLGTMLLSIVNPNAEIREGFQQVQVETTDGRSLTGFLTDRDTQVTVLRGLDGQDVVLRSSEIKSLEASGSSLMPEGLLEGLDEKALRDLFAYLRISQPITR